jgi:Protein of unknown function (DUF732)
MRGFSCQRWRLLALGAAVVAVAVGVFVAVQPRPKAPDPQTAFLGHLNDHGIRLGWRTNYIGKTVCTDLRQGVIPPAEEQKVQLQQLNGYHTDAQATPPDSPHWVVYYAARDLCPDQIK